MSDNIDNALNAAIRAMENVITPTIDPAHPLATEQAELVTRTLKLLKAQLPYRMSKAIRDLFETVEMASSLLPLAKWSPEITGQLSRATESGREILRSAASSQECVDTATRSIDVRVCALVRAARIAQVHEQMSIEEIVLLASKELVTNEIAWFEAQGWATSGTVPGIEERFA